MNRLLQRNLQPSLFSHLAFSCISSQFSPLHILSNLVYSSGSGPTPWLFTLHFLRSIFLGILSSPIPITSKTIFVCFFECDFLFRPLLVPILCQYFLSCPSLFRFKLLSKFNFHSLNFVILSRLYS